MASSISVPARIVPSMWQWSSTFGRRSSASASVIGGSARITGPRAGCVVPFDADDASAVRPPGGPVAHEAERGTGYSPHMAEPVVRDPELPLEAPAPPRAAGRRG